MYEFPLYELPPALAGGQRILKTSGFSRIYKKENSLLL
jgi:hypothetical protein